MRLALIFFALAACEKKSLPIEIESGSPSASVARPPPVEAGPPKNEWSGSYTAHPAQITVPDGGEWAGVKFRGEDASDGLGEGPLHIEISAANIVSGEGDGALGGFAIAGSSSGNTITFSVRRKDPKDMGFTGTGRATISENKIDGSLRVSKATGNVIREADFSLHR